MSRKLYTLLFVVLAATLMLSSVIAQDDNEYGLPDYYPDDYMDIIEASMEEMETVSDGLIIYSIMGEGNWAPVLEAFYAKYPWTEGKVTALDLGSYEVFERYLSESSSNARTSDMIITTGYDVWPGFMEDGNIIDYTSPEEEYVPEWTWLADGVYTFSSDPMLLIYNKILVENPPASLADLAVLVEEDTDTYAGKITTYDVPTNATGFAINWFWLKQNGEDGWSILETIGLGTPTRQSSAGNMANSVISGEALVGYFVSAISVFNKFPEAEPVLGWDYIHDGQPILVRAMGITEAASAPNTAKLMMDFVLSAEGQIAVGTGGLTAYREDVAEDAPSHLNTIIEAVGEENMVYFYLDPELTDQDIKDEFIERWDTTVPAPGQ